MVFALIAILTLTAPLLLPGWEILITNPFATVPPKLAVLDVLATVIALPTKTVTRMAAVQLANRMPIAQRTMDLSQWARTRSVPQEFVSILTYA